MVLVLFVIFGGKLFFSKFDKDEEKPLEQKILVQRSNIRTVKSNLNNRGKSLMGGSVRVNDNSGFGLTRPPKSSPNVKLIKTIW